MHFILVGLLSSKPILVVTATDVAGEVVEVGSNVKSFKAGDKVVAMLNTLVGQILFICLIFATSLLHFGPWSKPVSEGPAQSLHSFSMDVVIVPCSILLSFVFGLLLGAKSPHSNPPPHGTTVFSN